MVVKQRLEKTEDAAQFLKSLEKTKNNQDGKLGEKGSK